MKKFGLILFAFLAMSVCAVAQGEGRQRGERRMQRMNKEQMVERMTQRQVERLKLTDEQTAQMKVLNEALVTEMMSQRPERNDSVPRKELTREEREEMRKQHQAKMEEMQNNYVTLVQAVLTPEQFTEFEKMQKERPRGPRPGGPRGPRGDRGGFDGDRGGFDGEDRD